MQKEFDNYIKNYRNDCDNALWISGESSDYFAHYKAQKLAQWFKPNIDKKIKILDFGCGDGLMINYVSSIFKSAEVFGIDSSPKSIEKARKNFPHINFSINSETSSTLSFESNSFDLIFSASTFHHISFSMHEAYARELLRLLKPKKHLVIFELNPLNPLTVYTFKRNPIDKNAKMLPPWYTYQLFKKYTPQIKFYCFFPKFLKWLRPFESLLTMIPVGALYAIILKKNKL